MTRIRKCAETASSLNVMVTAELKCALDEAARKYNVNMADIVRLSIRTMLPVLAALWQSQQVVLDELVARSEGHFRKRHTTFDEAEDYEPKQGSGPC